MSVEIFETLVKPRRRIWDQVYDSLYIREGRDMSTFDRQCWHRDRQTARTGEGPAERPVLPQERVFTVRGPESGHDGAGTCPLRKASHGDQDQRGLTLESGLEIEAAWCCRRKPGRRSPPKPSRST